MTMHTQRPLTAALTRPGVKPRTMHHAVLRVLGTGTERSGRQLWGTHPFPQSYPHSWQTRMIELADKGLVEKAGVEDRAGPKQATTYRITSLGLQALSALEDGVAWPRV